MFEAQLELPTVTTHFAEMLSRVTCDRRFRSLYKMIDQDNW
jgi:hypothetical protein